MAGAAAARGPCAPVFRSATGGPLIYANVYNRVLRPALRKSGIAVVVDRRTVIKRGTEVEEEVWDYQGVAFHAFRKACGSLLLAHGKSLKQVQGWLRHSQLTTTMNVYIHQVDDGLGGADAWDEILTVGEGGASCPREAAEPSMLAPVPPGDRVRVEWELEEIEAEYVGEQAGGKVVIRLDSDDEVTVPADTVHALDED